MSSLRLPANWRTLSFPQKAAYLCTTRQARDYSEACSMLARLPRRPSARSIATAARDFWWNK
jgi:hypothetical protein